MKQAIQTMSVGSVLIILVASSFGVEPNRQEIDTAVNATLNALYCGSSSYKCFQLRPASNITALGTTELGNQERMGLGGRLTARENVTLPKEGTLAWNQGRFRSSCIEAHINPPNASTVIFQRDFAWDGQRLTSLRVKGRSIYNALNQGIPDFQIIEDSLDLNGVISENRGEAIIQFDPIVWVLERSHIAGFMGPIINAQSIEFLPDGKVKITEETSFLILDPAQGYLPIRIERMMNMATATSRIMTVEVAYAPIGETIWFPVRLVKSETEDEELLYRSEYNVTSYSLEPPETGFDISFLPGTHVEDDISGEEYIVGQ